jgi:hypothetical protein
MPVTIKVNKKLKTERRMKNGQPRKKKWQPRVHKTKYKTKQKHSTICVGHHYPQTNTNNANNTPHNVRYRIMRVA